MATNDDRSNLPAMTKTWEEWWRTRRYKDTQVHADAYERCKSAWEAATAELREPGPCGVHGHLKADWNMYDSFCERCSEIEEIQEAHAAALRAKDEEIAALRAEK